MSRAPRKPNSAGLPARQAATALLSAVLDDRQPLDSLLETGGGSASFNALDSRDRRLARAIVSTALRRFGEIDTALDRLIARRPRRSGALLRILQIAAAQILFMEVADHAAVSLAMEQIGGDRDGRHFKGLANAVLRRLSREHETILAGIDAPRVNTPDWLWTRWEATYGVETARRIAEAHLVEPSLDLSVKDDPAGWAERLGGVMLPTGTVRLSPSGPVSELAGFEAGQWWVQDAAAALPAMLLGDVRGKRVADLCAAPGGKTARLAAGGGDVTAVDISADRLRRLSENLARLDLEAGIVVADILAWQPAEPFDAILLDAPCTATGTIRRHPDAARLKRESDVADLATLQSRMIDRVVPWLKTGGLLVFCTCSLEPEEGERQLTRALDRHPLSLSPVGSEEIGGMDNLLTASGAVRTLPCALPDATPRLSGLDGFFIARLVKS